MDREVSSPIQEDKGSHHRACASLPGQLLATLKSMIPRCRQMNLSTFLIGLFVVCGGSP
jgi:hypothetical protein